MRPGAAVRLRGTWVDESRKKSAIDGSAHIPGTSGESELSMSPEQSELKVSEVEILGGSDPMVRVSRLFQHPRTFFSHSLDISDSEQIPDSRKPSHDLASSNANSSQLHHATSTIRCHCYAHTVLLP